MALYTRVELARLCGVSSGDLSNYIKRQKVYVSRDGDGNEVIDDTLPANAEFLKKRQEMMREKGVAAPVIEQKGPESVKSAAKPDSKGKKDAKPAKKGTEEQKRGTKKEKSDTPPAVAKKKPEDGPPVFVEPSREDLLNMGIKTRNAWLESEKLRLEIEAKQLQAMKVAGTVVPVEAAKGIIKEYAKSITDRFMQITTDVLNEVTQLYNADRKVIADMRKRVIESINSGVKNSVQDGVGKIDVMVDDYSDTRGRGEKKLI